MENDVLKNQIAPWQSEGRWYKGTYIVDTPNNSYTIIEDETDQLLVDGYNNLRPEELPAFVAPLCDAKKYIICDAKIISYATDPSRPLMSTTNYITIDYSTSIDDISWQLAPLISAVSNAEPYKIELYIFIKPR